MLRPSSDRQPRAKKSTGPVASPPDAEAQCAPATSDDPYDDESREQELRVFDQYGEAMRQIDASAAPEEKKRAARREAAAIFIGAGSSKIRQFDDEARGLHFNRFKAGCFDQCDNPYSKARLDRLLQCLRETFGDFADEKIRSLRRQYAQARASFDAFRVQTERALTRDREKAKREPAAAGSENNVDQQPMKRPAYNRDRLWLQWSEEENAANGDIRDRWNSMADAAREAYKPCHAKVGSGKPGWDIVRKGIKAAKKNREAEVES